MRFFIRKLLPLTLTLLLILPDIARATNVGDSLVIGIQSTKTTLIEPLDPVERDMMSIYDLVYESLISPSPVWPKAGRNPATARPGPSTCARTSSSPTARP